MGSASGSSATRVLIARESCTGTYSLPTFSSNSWSLGTFSKIFMIGLPMMILCKRLSVRSKMWKSRYRVGLAIRTGAALRIPRQSKDYVGVTWSHFWDEDKGSSDSWVFTREDDMVLILKPGSYPKLSSMPITIQFIVLSLVGKRITSADDFATSSHSRSQW
jgi:hypothetical protein